MNRIRIFLARVRGLFLKRRLEQELDDEIRSHLEMQIEENLRHGMSAEEARYAALRKFGGVDQVKKITAKGAVFWASKRCCVTYAMAFACCAVVPASQRLRSSHWASASVRT